MIHILSLTIRTIAALGLALILTPPLGARPDNPDKAVTLEKNVAEALSKLPSAERRFVRGQELFSSGDLDKAAREFEACLKILPEHIYASYYLANIRYIQQDLSRSLEAIENAERHLDFMAAVSALAREKKLAEFDEAKRLLEAENEVNFSCRESRQLEQMVLDVETEEAKTGERMRREQESRQKQAAHYAYFHGNVLFRLGKYDEAFQSYNRAIRIDPRNGDAYNNAASILFLAGRHREAEDYIHKAAAAGVEDRINLKLKKLVTEGLGKSPAGILEQEFGTEGGELRVMRFSINVYEGQPHEAPFFVNSYIIHDRGSRDAVIIDPGAADPRLEAYIKENGLRPRLILNTHGHYDHRHGNAYYAGLYGLKTAVPREEASAYKPEAGSPGATIDLVFLESEVRAGTLLIKTYPTPGHTPGGVCFLIGSYLFSGDSLFEDTVGRVAAETPSAEQKSRKRMVGALTRLLDLLPGETVLLPGHGQASTVARTKEVNPFLQTGKAS